MMGTAIKVKRGDVSRVVGITGLPFPTVYSALNGLRKGELSKVVIRVYGALLDSDEQIALQYKAGKFDGDNGDNS